MHPLLFGIISTFNVDAHHSRWLQTGQRRATPMAASKEKAVSPSATREEALEHEIHVLRSELDSLHKVRPQLGLLFVHVCACLQFCGRQPVASPTSVYANYAPPIACDEQAITIINHLAIELDIIQAMDNVRQVWGREQRCSPSDSHQMWAPLYPVA